MSRDHTSSSRPLVQTSWLDESDHMSQIYFLFGGVGLYNLGHFNSTSLYMYGSISVRPRSTED